MDHQPLDRGLDLHHRSSVQLIQGDTTGKLGCAKWYFQVWDCCAKNTTCTSAINRVLAEKEAGKPQAARNTA